MTVAELIEKLKMLPQDLHVNVEGCDCIGKAVDAYIYKDWREETYVLIGRNIEGESNLI